MYIHMQRLFQESVEKIKNKGSQQLRQRICSDQGARRFETDVFRHAACLKHFQGTGYK